MGFSASKKIKIKLHGDPQSYLELAFIASENITRKIVITTFYWGYFQHRVYCVSQAFINLF